MELTVNILAYVLLTLLLFAGSALTVLQLPGTWFILAATLTYAWSYDWQRVTTLPLLIMAGIAALAELIELLAGMFGARRFGASRQAGWAALIGGFLGILIFTPLIPILVVGSILGGLIGCFAGAFVVEHRVHRDSARGARVGIGAVIGRLSGLFIKLLAALLMSAIALAAAFR